jgi:hypothetical protein
VWIRDGRWEHVERDGLSWARSLDESTAISATPPSGWTFGSRWAFCAAPHALAC